MLGIVEKAKLSQTQSETFRESFFLPLEPLKLGYRVFYIIVLANARKIGLFLFYKLMEGRVKHLEMVKLAASKKFKDSISIRM